MSGWRRESVDVTAGAARISVVYAERERQEPSSSREGEPLVYLHGLGSSGRDFEAAASAAELAGRRLIAPDLPGSGESGTPRQLALGVEELVSVVEQVLDAIAPGRVHLIGHSLGGLVGLLVASRDPARLETFVNVEGNLAPVDCRVFSRRAVELSATASPGEILEILASELVQTGRPGYSIFAERFRSEVRPEAFLRYCRSIVEISDREPLLETFRALPVPRLFVYGESNRDLPYLNELRDGGVDLVEIPRSDHFPLYTNPRSLFAALGSFVGPGKEPPPSGNRPPRGW